MFVIKVSLSSLVDACFLMHSNLAYLDEKTIVLSWNCSHHGDQGMIVQDIAVKFIVCCLQRKHHVDGAKADTLTNIS